MPTSDARTLGRRRLDALHRRRRRIRTVVAAALACSFIALFATISIQMAAGDDPALAAHTSARVVRAAAATSGATGATAAAPSGGSATSSATGATGAAPSGGSATGTTGTTGTGSGTAPAPMTTRQS